MENMVKFGSKTPSHINPVIWDEGGKTKILQIIISHVKGTVKSIQFVYVVDEKVVRSEMHGEPSGLKVDVVTFDYPGEYLTSLSGQYSDDYHARLTSITFGTNKRKYGPFGSEVVVSNYNNFAYNFSHKSSFGGFHGCIYDKCVYAIGVYVKPLQSLAEIRTLIGSVKSENN